jgi:hypothetical protein
MKTVNNGLCRVQHKRLRGHAFRVFVGVVMDFPNKAGLVGSFDNTALPPFVLQKL